MSSERQLLARFETISQFDKVIFRPCMHRTALCPDRCGHAKNWAEFKVVSYLAYEKPGEYGDSKDGQFAWDTKAGQGVGPAKEQQAKLAEKVSKLKSGDYVKLNWRHEYATVDGSSFPERPITLLELITPDEAKLLSAKGNSAQA